MKISLIGGDLRLCKLAILFAKDNQEKLVNYNKIGVNNKEVEVDKLGKIEKNNEVTVFAMEQNEEIMQNNNIIKAKTLEEALHKSEIIIASIPFLKSDGEMYANFSEEHIGLNHFTSKQYKEKIFISGSIKKEVKEKLEKCYGKVVDIMEQEELVILNTIATAEGAIDVAIKNTDIILQGSKVLILGFGRVAKVVASKFKGLSANITCAARKGSDLAWINTLGYNAKNIYELKEDLKQYDIIINTVPQMIINKEEMKNMKKEVLLIDLASAPGGINREDVQKMGLKFIWALALPGKVAPLTSAEFIKNAIYNYLKG